MITIEKTKFTIKTNNSVLIFEVKDNPDSDTHNGGLKTFVKLTSYGVKPYDKCVSEHGRYWSPLGSNDDYIVDCMPYSFVGIGNNKNNMLILENADDTYVNRFNFVKAEKISGEFLSDIPHARYGEESLVLHFFDDVANVELEQYYTCFQDSDVLAVCQRVVNKGTSPIYIDKLSSLQIDLPTTDCMVSTFDGKANLERIRHDNRITSGAFSVESQSGISSAVHNPFIIVSDNESGLKYAFNLIYSGNHKEQVEVSPYGTTRILTGINDFLFRYELKAGESFTTPQAITVCANSEDKITSLMHDFILNHIVRKEFTSSVRPVLYNSWEGICFGFNEQSLDELSTIAKDLGVELFVVDDGWFGKRNDDTTSLGDWFVNLEKIPCGLGAIANKVRDKGLKFGIWVEPEMISRNSELYRKHPEFAMENKGREPIERRNQLVIDMTNPEVQKYLIDSLTAVFSDVKPDYVKWDFNRTLIDITNTCGQKGEYLYRFILGTYKVVDELTKRFSSTLFESCSSGGCRYDLGMAYYMPQTWGSDDTNTVARMNIQCGTLAGYPQSTFGAHVTEDMSPASNDVSTLEDRFNLHSIGAFGYELDLRKLSLSDKEIIKKQIAYYKEHRALLQYGKYHCLETIKGDGKDYSYMTVNGDEEAFLVCFSRDTKIDKKIKIDLLDLNATYKISERLGRVKEQIKSGKDLKNKGLRLKFETHEKDYKGATSLMLYIKKVN